MIRLAVVVISLIALASCKHVPTLQTMVIHARATLIARPWPFQCATRPTRPACNALRG